MGEVLVRTGHADGSPDHPEVRDPDLFRRAAESLRITLVCMGVPVTAAPVPLLPHDPDGVPGKYVVIPRESA
jgi:hypothetical protein